MPVLRTFVLGGGRWVLGGHVIVMCGGWLNVVV